MKHYRIKVCTQKSGNQLIRLQRRTMLFFWTNIRWNDCGKLRTYYHSIEHAEERLARAVKFEEQDKQAKIIKCEHHYR